MENLNSEDKTRQYTVYITDQDNSVNGSGVLFYAGGDRMFVFTAAHVLDDLDKTRLVFLKPVNIERDLYKIFVTEISNDQVYYSPLDQLTIEGGEKVHSEDFAIIQVQKPESFTIEPTEYFIGDTSRNKPIYIQGYPNGVPKENNPVEYLDCFHGSVVVNIPDNNRFTIRITDNFLDAGNRVYELKGLSGGPIWDGQKSDERQPQNLLGMISSAYASTGLLSKIFAVKLQQIRTLMREKFGIVIERKLLEIPEEEVAGDRNTSVLFDGTVNEKEQIEDKEKWINDQISACRCYIDGLQLQKAIDTVNDAIKDSRFSFCNKDSQKRLMKYLLYCYEIGDLDVEFDLLEKDMRDRELLEKYDVLRHMSRSFMKRKYDETIDVAEKYLTENHENKALFACANAFLFLAKAYEEQLPVEETIGKLLDEHENFLLDTETEDETAFIYQLIGFVYGERYHDYVNAVRFLNRSYRVGFNAIVLESLGAAYYFLGISGATGEDKMVDLKKVDRKALYKARECFLIIIQKADALFWEGTMRRVGLCIYNTFVFLNDNYRILTIYPDVKKYITPPEGEEPDKFWRDIEMKYARIVAQSGNVNTMDYPYIHLSDKFLLETISRTSQCMEMLEKATADLRPIHIRKNVELKKSIKAIINETENNVRKIDRKDRLPVYVQLMNIYGRGMILFGWEKIDKLEYYLERIRSYGDLDLIEAMENFIYEFKAPIADVIQRYRQTFERKRDLISWQELNHLYVRHGMLDEADTMYRELLGERKELIEEEPEYAYRAYIDYIILYHRDLRDALQCYLDAKEAFQDTDIQGFWELELMVYTNTWNDPERFEIERKPFMEKGLVTEEQFHKGAFIAYMVNLNEEKAREHFEYITKCPHMINPVTNSLVMSLEEIHFLNWIGDIKPRFTSSPQSMTKDRINGIGQWYRLEYWHRKIDITLKNHFNINKKIAIDAWGLYYIADTIGLDILDKCDAVYVSHPTIIRLLEELSRTDNGKIREILNYIGLKKVFTIRTAEFKTQMEIRNNVDYVEPATAVATAIEQKCLVVLGEQALESRLIDKFGNIIIRPDEIQKLIE